MAGTSTSRRGLLAFIWSVINTLTFVSYIVAFLFTYTFDNNDNNGDNNNAQERGRIIEVAVTSRAMAFSSLWTAVLATILAVFGTVVLGFQSPTGVYYACCLGNVHETTPTSIGSFVGSLIMFSNLTLVCAVLFGEFEVRDYQSWEGQDAEDEDMNVNHHNAADRSSLAFSIVCIIMTIMYASFAALVYIFSNSILEENLADAMMECRPPSNTDTLGGGLGGVSLHPSGGFQTQSGYIGGDRFDVRPPMPTTVGGGFVTQQSDSSLG